MPKLDSIEAVKAHFDWAPYSKERWATHNLSSLNLIPFINERNPKLVIDIGCGKNNFKGLVPNCIGLDVSDYPEADLNMSLEEVYDRNIFQHGCADVVMALGSLNFGTFDNIISQFGKAIDWVKPGGIFIVRVRLHLDKEEAFYTRGHQQHNWNWENVEENFFDIAPGAAIGQKWVNKKGWTFEITGGVGRFLLNKDENNEEIGRAVESSRPEALLRGGFSIGKRF